MHACVPCDNDADAVLKTRHTGTLTREGRKGFIKH